MKNSEYKYKTTVIPAQAGIQRLFTWIPAFAGMTMLVLLTSTAMAQTRAVQVAPPSDRPEPIVTETIKAPATPVAVEPTMEEKCVNKYDLKNLVKFTIDDLIKEYKTKATNINNNYYFCFTGMLSKPLLKPIHIENVSDTLIIVDLSLIIDAKLDSSSISISSSTAPITFENLTITNAKTGIEIGANVAMVSVVNSDDKPVISCSAGAGSVGLKVAPESHGAIISGFTIKGCDVGIKNDGIETSLLGGSIEGPGSIGVDSLGVASTVDQDMVINGFKVGAHFAGSDHLMAGVSVACLGADLKIIPDSVAIQADANASTIGPDNMAKDCAKGIVINGQKVFVTKNKLNAITSGQRVVRMEGANEGVKDFVDHVYGKEVNIWSYISRNAPELIEKIVIKHDVGGMFELFSLNNLNDFDSGIKSECTLMEAEQDFFRKFKISDEDINKGFYLCDKTNINKKDSKIWLVFNDKDFGSSSATSSIELKDIPDGPNAIPTGETLRMDAGLDGGDVGDVDIVGSMGADDGSDLDPLSGGQDFIDPPAETPAPADNGADNDEKKVEGGGNNFGSDIGLNSGGGGNIETAPLDSVGGSMGFAKSGCTLDRTSASNNGALILFAVMIGILVAVRKSVLVRC